MRRRKQALAAVLAGLLAFGLTACGSFRTAAGQTESVQQTESARQTEAASERSNETEEASAENETADGVVQTTAGLVQGTSEDGIYRYLGVPYAEAKERFVPAENVTPWEGVRMADAYGPMSPQGGISGLGDAGSQDGTDNNSQNLNIWTPGVNDGEKRPVMVWLHGGGFSTGSANEEGYDGGALSRSGNVVVVSVNHRLNVFGYLDLSAYGEKYKDFANVGIRDIVDSLEWIQENIEAFGGDPDNVTVFGQSGGGAKVLALMSSPYAKGLFHKGIVQSGATETMGVIFNSQESSTRLAEKILEKLGITAENIEDIQTVSVEELEAAAAEALPETGEELKLPAALGGGYSMDWEPVVDGDFLPTNPVTEESFAEAGLDIPLLIGSNLNEWSGFFESEPIEPKEELTTALREAYPNKPELTAEQVDTTTIRLPLLKIMTHKADQNGAPVYAYLFTYGNSYHGAEIPYVFNHADGNQEEQALAEQVSQAWINFAKTGTPGAEGLPDWEPYTREGGATMLLDTEPELVYHHDRDLLSLLVPDYWEESEGTEREETAGGRTLVVYYSAGGHTEAVANVIAETAGADLFELEPTKAYTSDDLNYNNDNSRVSREHENEDLRNVELVSTTVENWDSYDTVLIGYPIWWGIAAWPVNSFVEDNDFTGKTVIPFCTSASSGLGKSGELLAEMAGSGDWQEEIRFRSNVSEEDVNTWVESLGL